MQVFDRCTTDYIADRLIDYFRSKRDKKRLTLEEAQTLIDHEAGPVPGGKNRYRPTDDEIARIFTGMPEASPWDDVIETLLIRCQSDPEKEKTIFYTFRDCLPEEDICERMHISRSSYFDRRSKIIYIAGILAVQAGVLQY